MRTMVQAQTLLVKQDDDAEEPSYTDKQVAIIRRALADADVSVDEIAEATDSHPNYVRDILTRVRTEELWDREEFEDFPQDDIHIEPEEDDDLEEEADDENQESEDEESEDDTESEEAVEEFVNDEDADARVQEDEESAANEVPAEDPTEEPEYPEGDIVLTMEDDVPMSVEVRVPHAVVERAVHNAVQMADTRNAGQSSTAENTVRLDEDLIDAVAGYFEIGTDRAKQIILKVGVDRARGLVEAGEETEELLEEVEIEA